MRYWCFSVLIVTVLLTPAFASADAREALVVIADFADRLCSTPASSGSANRTELSGSLSADLANVLKKLVGLGANAAAKYEKEEYNGVLQKDLASSLEKSNECKLQVFSLLSVRLLNESPAGCRHPSNGLEYWGHTERWKADSGWRKGGSSPDQYCGAQKLGRERQYPERQVALLDTGEDHKTKRDPFKRDFYRYTCSFEDRWQPIYKFGENPACKQ